VATQNDVASALAALLRNLGSTPGGDPFAHLGPSEDFGRVGNDPVIPQAVADHIAGEIDAAVARGDVQIITKVLGIVAGVVPGLRMLLG